MGRLERRSSISGKTLKAAVVGAGHMGRHHARVYHETPDCELVAVIDKDPARARELAAKYGCAAHSRLSDVACELDAVSVAVPTVLHADVAIPIMERGIAVLVEKPLAADIAGARELLDASRRYRCLLQVGHSERFNPVVQALLRMEVRPKFIETQRVSPFTFRSADIGVVFDMMIHDIDIILHLAGRGEYAIDAVGVNVLGECEDVANARIRFAEGVIVNMTASRLALKTERRIRVFCPSAYVSMDYQKKSGVAVKLSANLDLIRMARERDFDDLSQMQHLDFGSLLKVEPLAVEDKEPLRAEIDAFLASVRDGSPAAVSAEEGFRSVEMAQRITECIQRQDWGVTMDEAGVAVAGGPGA